MIDERIKGSFGVSCIRNLEMTPKQLVQLAFLNLVHLSCTIVLCQKLVKPLSLICFNHAWSWPLRHTFILASVFVSATA